MLLRNKYKPIRPLKSIQGNLKTYDINDLFLQKLSAFSDRKTARDLYDIAFIVDTYYSDLDYSIKRKFFDLLKSEENILDLIPEYEEVFKEDNILDLTDLLESVKRLVNFYKKMEIDLQQKKNNTRNNRKPK